MATANPVPCDICKKREGYLGCPNCRNHICYSCAPEYRARDPLGRAAYLQKNRCPECNGTEMYPNAGDRW